MSDITVYHLKACDTCRKARKALTAAGHNVTAIDVRADGVPREVLVAAQDQFGAALLNTRSTTWRGLDAAARDGDALDLIAAHPALMKRPLIDVGGTLYLGWTKEVQAALGV